MLAFSIRSRLVALIVAVVLPLFAVLVWAFSEQVRREHAAAGNMALRLARSVRGDLEDANRESQELSARIATHPLVREGNAGACRSLVDVVDASSLTGMILLDGSGEPRCSVTPVTSDAALLTAVARAIPGHLAGNGGGPAVPFFLHQGSQWLMVGLYPVKGSTDAGSTLALVQHLDLHLDGYPPETVISIIDDDDRILYRSVEPERWLGKVMRNTPIARVASREKEGRLEALGLDGVHRQYGFTHTANGWRISVGLPANVAMATVRSLLVNGLLAGLIILAIVVFFAVRLSRSIERPLNELTGAAKRVAESGFSGDVPSTGPRELANVAEAFNHMVRSRAAAERELIESRAQLEALSEALLHVQENERTRIAREIHDELGQLLTALNMDVTGLLGTGPLDDRQTAMAHRIRAALATMLDSVQRISAELRPAVLDDFGLSAAIESEVRSFEERTGIECELSMHRDELTVSPQVDAAIYRIVQEALTNVARHSDASRVELRVRERPGELFVDLRDDGRGLPPAALTDRRSLGLIGMRERARGIGATLEIEGIAGRGTIVSLRVPMAARGLESET